MRNCDGQTNPNFALKWDVTGEVDRCPNVWFASEVWAMVDLWSDWRFFKSLPFPGSVGEQPYQVIQLIGYCESVIARIQLEGEDS